ncbi:DUF4345 domain-containing protein [Telluribacter sp. SYSU D00476]|uniref:DUF4345 domain-containing protein n=1 Tax=Telluribacter sp. SYSU D00476 TaxID=2811430 RepID=UPI001FF39C8D|nr:DUF4345 domain-containing protein [Telluribacter sp. SYSU D00476]
MKKQQLVNGLSKALLSLSALSIFSVCLMAFSDPQSVMDLVGVKLTNTDAYSSIRGVYGGVSLTIVVLLVYLLLRDVTRGLIFISILWGSYAVSRVTTILVEGSLGDFGQQWLVIESVLCACSLLLLFLKTRLTTHPQAVSR